MAILQLPFTKEHIETSIPVRFANVVEQFPTNTAVTDHDKTINYQELDQASDKLAQLLVESLGSDNVPVILLLPHKINVIIGIMGVLKANKAYVVVDPALPTARQELIMNESGAQAIVIDRATGHLVNQFDQTISTLIDIDNLPDIVEKTAVSVPVDSIAGIFFTSGSTGTPKGIARSHRTAIHRTWFEIIDDHIYPEDKTALVFKCSFGASVADIFNPLLSGGTLCLFDFDVDGLAGFSTWVREQQLTRLHIPVMLFRRWLDTLTPDDQFHHVILCAPSGRQMWSDYERGWQHLSPECVFVNRFSTSETSMVTRYLISPQTVQDQELPPIGQAIPGKQVLLLDEQGQPVPQGEEGEIVVRSRYMSQGYWQRPDLSADKFVPADDGSEEMLYFSGDLGRLSEDNQLEWLGRRDFQVKIRGYRVVLSEVEAALDKVADIKAAAVVPDDSNSRLIAYLVSKSGETLSASAIRKTLAETLPDYMLPSYYVFVSSLPLTPNGKLNRKKLPSPIGTRPLLETPFVAPETEQEQEIAQLWSEVLEIDKVGLNDDFIELGGNSLTAAAILARMSRNFGVDLPQQALFNAPTVARFILALKDYESQDDKIRPSTGPLVPSYAQERLWFVQQLEPDSVAYNMPKRLQMRGELNLEALQKSLDFLMARHDILRTVFKQENGEPIPHLLTEWTLPLPCVEMSRVPSAQIEQTIQDEIKRPFNLATDLMMRATLYQLKEDEHILLLVTHHIATDHLSSAQMLRELRTCYRAFVQDTSPDLPPLTLRYSDFAAWQRENVATLTEQAAYWQEKLANITPLELPTDRVRPAKQTFNGRRVNFTVPQPIAGQLQDLSRREGVTLFMTIFSAMAVLLQRYANEDDIAVGALSTNRNHIALEHVMGFFINPLVLRTNLANEPSFAELLQRVKETVLDAFAHQDVPFEHVVSLAQPDRDLSRSPLFQVMLDYVSASTLPSSDWLNLTAQRQAAYNERSPYDLSLYLIERNGGMTGSWEYNTALFDHETIENLSQQFLALLEHAAAAPETAVKQLSLLPKETVTQMMVDWNDTAVAYPDNLCIHHLFEQQVEKSPNQTALIDGQESIRYDELNQRANRWANHLRSLGVGPEKIVGVSFHRSIDMIVALLGVLKAGGAYLPLDPNYPQERIAFMLEDSGVDLILTQRNVAERLPEHEATLICVDEGDPNAEPNNPDVAMTPDNMAYVVYTSGSTGRPKGVMGLHRSCVNRFSWMMREYPLLEGDVCCQKTSLNFVDSIWEIFEPLSHGLPLLLIPDPILKNPDALMPLLQEHKVTRFILVPSLLRLFLDTYPDLGHRIPALRLWIASGEALPRDLCRQFYEALPDATLLNLYGLSEVWDVTCYDTRLFEDDRPNVPIGKPIDNMQTFILDADKRPSPVGTIGELYVGGVNLSRGYWQQEALTAERFVELSLPGLAEPIRLLGTGDRARHLPDGNIEYHGRRDHQIKLRGYRIELGEIESVMRQHDLIQDVAVVVRGEKLVAYVVGETVESAELKKYLRENLPAYMIPAQMMQLDQLPLTPSGKVDRLRLPEPEIETVAIDVDEHDPLIVQLKAIWEEVLGIESVGIHDDFFELGGHSLTLARLITKIQRRLGFELPMAVIFQASTIATLAQQMRLEIPETAVLIPINTKGEKTPFFCVHGWGGFVSGYGPLARSMEGKRPFYGLQAIGVDEGVAADTTVEAMAARYVSAIKQIQPEGPYHLGGYCLGGIVAYEMAQQLRANGDQVGELALMEAYVPYQIRQKTAVWNDTNAWKAWFQNIGYWAGHLSELGGEGILRAVRLKLAKNVRNISSKLGARTIELDIAHIPEEHRDVAVQQRTAVLTYHPQAYEGTLTLYRTRSQSLTKLTDQTLGWTHLVNGNVQVKFVEGWHHNILELPYVESLASELSDRLEKW